MKKLFKTSVCALMALLAFNACSVEEECGNENQLATVHVVVNMPEGFEMPFNGEVTISNEQVGKTYTANAENGRAVFEEVYPGVYDVVAHLALTKEQAQAAAPQANILNNIVINGLTNDFTVKTGEPCSETTFLNIINVKAYWSVESSLVISRIFCNGTKNNNGKNNNGPKYYEIFNNSAEVQYLDGLCLASAHGLTTGKNPCQLYEEHPEATYAARIVRLPGVHGTDKNIALEPGKSFVIASNARNFILTEDSKEGAADKCTMNVDLTGADYEIEANKNPRLGFVDNVNVPNMTYSHDCFDMGPGFNEMNQGIFIFFATEEEINGWETGCDEKSYMAPVQKKWAAKRVSNDIILDAVETLKEGTKLHKRIADVVDGSGVQALNNKGIIFNRRIAYMVGERMVLQDTNNSARDFVAVGSKDAANYDGAHLAIRNYSASEIQPK